VKNTDGKSLPRQGVTQTKPTPAVPMTTSNLQKAWTLWLGDPPMGIQAPRAAIENGSDSARAYLNVHFGSTILLLGFIDLTICFFLIAVDLAKLMEENASIKRFAAVLEALLFWLRPVPILDFLPFPWLFRVLVPVFLLDLDGIVRNKISFLN
jgi:hypothetical protein